MAAEVYEALLFQVPVAFREFGIHLFQPPDRFFGLRFPALPTRQVLLELEPGPPVMPIGEQHPAVQIVQIGHRFHGFERRRSGFQEPLGQGLALLDQRRGLILFACLEGVVRAAIEIGELLGGGRIPGLPSGIERR